MDVKHCRGCYCNFYNGRQNVGGTECWSLKTAKLVMRKEVHINDMPPHKHKPQKLPNCYHKPQFVYIDAKREY
jgi:hypothetical protein